MNRLLYGFVGPTKGRGQGRYVAKVRVDQPAGTVDLHVFEIKGNTE